MKTVPQSPTLINNIDTDFKAEVVAASLLNYHIAAEQIFIKRIGINNRAKNKDVRQLRKEVFEFDTENIVIETNREGIYDYLPEGFFHPPTLGGLGKGINEIVDEIKRQKKSEYDARKFFLPFEIETSYTELAALCFENSLDYKNLNNDLLDILTGLWPLLAEIEPQNAKIFIHLLPFFHSARGNKAWFEKCLSAFLATNVTITYSTNEVSEVDNINELLLSNTVLGVNTILCGSHIDGNRNWQVNIGPIPSHEVGKYLPGSSFNELLQTIYNNCLPITATAAQRCITTGNKHSFVLPPRGENENYLGFTTFLYN